MYTLAIRRDFIARHYLIGGDWGPENYPNSHHYVLELQLGGRRAGFPRVPRGYRATWRELSASLSPTTPRSMLNDLPEFKDLNPSLEHFARIIATAMSERITAANIASIKVVLWENDLAWASYSVKPPSAR